MPIRHRMIAAVAVVGAVSTAGLMAAPVAQALPATPHAFISHFHHRTTIASTVPSNGDINPYGVFVVRQSIGRLHRGDVLVSNFNAKSNEQGTGKTIVEISPSGHRTLFAHIFNWQVAGRCPGGVGLTTALEVLKGGWVVVGSLPSKNGSAATARAGCLIVLNRNGRVAETFRGHGINGPWDSTMSEHGRIASLFVTNVLNGGVQHTMSVVHQGTVLRLTLLLRNHMAPQLLSTTKIGSRAGLQQTNAAAFVLGATGVGLSRHGRAVRRRVDLAEQHDHGGRARAGPAGRAARRRGMLLTAGGKLNSAAAGFAVAPRGSDILTVNGNNGLIVETTPAGKQIASRLLDNTPPAPLGAGALFGLAVKPGGHGIYYVDDAVNTLRLLH